MDRRRFVPSSEGLETRQMLSTAGATAASKAAVVSTPTAKVVGARIDAGSDFAETIQTKLRQIENLPFFLGRLTKDNVLPEPAIRQIQGGLYSLVGQLHPSNPDLVRKFNLDLRRALSNQNIRPTDAATLNNDFDAVLQAAGASATARASLRDGMNQLAQFDSAQRSSAIVTANHYATVLQVALGSGRPLIQPNAPRLVPADRASSGKIDVAKNPQPTFTGVYAEGAQIQIVDGQGIVLGVGTVDITGNYKVRIDRVLADGNYTVLARATDSDYFSDLSKPYTFTIKAPVVRVNAAHPSGPR